MGNAMRYVMHGKCAYHDAWEMQCFTYCMEKVRIMMHGKLHNIMHGHRAYHDI
jgi:hypothetical protein